MYLITILFKIIFKAKNLELIVIVKKFIVVHSKKKSGFIDYLLTILLVAATFC
ncbi:hypothetical protein FLAVO9R_290030 [Flavobacterium sp. 9R]|nr:hypothetical protein FLAVO9R_290030 [Flavobacterium sp. 9R]